MWIELGMEFQYWSFIMIILHRPPRIVHTLFEWSELSTLPVLKVYIIFYENILNLYYRKPKYTTFAFVLEGGHIS
jgi:branched-subunit amino acid transport protein AzlD